MSLPTSRDQIIDRLIAVGKADLTTSNHPTGALDTVAAMGLVHDLCRYQQWNYMLHYCDGSDQWYYNIDKEESPYITKDYTLSTVLEVVLEDHRELITEMIRKEDSQWLDKLLTKFQLAGPERIDSIDVYIVPENTPSQTKIELFHCWNAMRGRIDRLLVWVTTKKVWSAISPTSKCTEVTVYGSAQILKYSDEFFTYVVRRRDTLGRRETDRDHIWRWRVGGIKTEYVSDDYIPVDAQAAFKRYLEQWVCKS